MQVAWLWFILDCDNGLPPQGMIIHDDEYDTIAIGTITKISVSLGPMYIMA